MVRKAKLHDCGAHGWLTIRQICGLAGLPESTVYRRVRDGVTGEALFLRRLPYAPTKHGAHYTTELRGIGNAVELAFRIARAFPTRAPTRDELERKFSMSRATAYRWRRAWLDANGVAA